MEGQDRNMTEEEKNVKKNRSYAISKEAGNNRGCAMV